MEYYSAECDSVANQSLGRPQSMENSHRINAVLTGYLKHPAKLRRGGVARMFDWGDKAQHSAAAYEIIKQAKAMPEGEKLTVIALGH